MTSREVPRRMTLSRETESRDTDSRESALSIEVTPSGSDAAIKISVPPIDDEQPAFALGDDEQPAFALGDDQPPAFALGDDEPTAITKAIGPRLTPLPARARPSERPSRPAGRMTMSPLGATSKKGGA